MPKMETVKFANSAKKAHFRRVRHRVYRGHCVKKLSKSAQHAVKIVFS